MVSSSTAECELMEMMEGNLAALSIGELVHEVYHPQSKEEKNTTAPKSFREYIDLKESFTVREEVRKPSILLVDNKAALQIIQQDGGSWRTRHLRVRSAAIKDQTESGRLLCFHTPGKVQLADLNTKSHPVSRLEELKELWGIVKAPKPEKTESKDKEVRVKAVRVVEKVTYEEDTEPTSNWWIEKALHYLATCAVAAATHFVLEAIEGNCGICKRRNRKAKSSQTEEQEEAETEDFELIEEEIPKEEASSSSRRVNEEGLKVEKRVWVTPKGEKFHTNPNCLQIRKCKLQLKELCKTCERYEEAKRKNTA
jgi:hypothetical protein